MEGISGWKKLLTKDHKSDVSDPFHQKSYKEILEHVKSKNLGDTLNKHTYFYHIMNRVNNGDKIVWKKLDDYVMANTNDINDPNFQLQIDFCRLESITSKSDVIKDIIDINEIDSTKVLLHPVIKSYIDLRWRKMKHPINLNFLFYLLFLFFYSWFFANIYWRELHYNHTPHEITDILKDVAPAVIDTEVQGPMIAARMNVNLKNKLEGIESFVDALVLDDYTVAIFKHSDSDTSSKNQSFHPTFSRCHWDNQFAMRACALEVTLSLTIVILLIIFILKIWSLGPYTTKDRIRHKLLNLENVMEVAVRFLAIACLVWQSDSQLLKYFAAFGIFFAYLEFIFVLGRLPWSPAGLTSIMFYNLTRKIVKNLMNLLILLIGCSFGFFILQKDSPHDHFENPFKSIVKTMVMALGEFDLTDLLEGKLNESYDQTTLYFNMILVTLLAILGCLVMVNLVVAIIVSDVQELRQDVEIQSSINKAYQIVQFGSIFRLKPTIQNSKIPNVIHRIAKAEDATPICVHNICRDCNQVKLNSPNCETELLNIVQKRTL